MSAESNSSETFVTLMRIAQEDSEVRKQLSVILAMETHQRRSALATFKDQVLLQRGSNELVSAISCLERDDIAAQARAFLFPQAKRGIIYGFLTLIKWTLSILFGGAAFVAIACVLMLCIDTWIIPVVGIMQILIMTAAFIVGAVFGVLSFVGESWYWLIVCAVIYGFVGYLISGIL